MHIKPQHYYNYLCLWSETTHRVLYYLGTCTYFWVLAVNAKYRVLLLIHKTGKVLQFRVGHARIWCRCNCYHPDAFSGWKRTCRVSNKIEKLPMLTWCWSCSPACSWDCRTEVGKGFFRIVWVTFASAGDPPGSPAPRGETFPQCLFTYWVLSATAPLWFLFLLHARYFCVCYLKFAFCLWVWRYIHISYLLPNPSPPLWYPAILRLGLFCYPNCEQINWTQRNSEGKQKRERSWSAMTLKLLRYVLVAIPTVDIPTKCCWLVKFKTLTSLQCSGTWGKP